MAKQKKTNRGPYIKNAHLIGKGGGQIKPVDGSFVKGAVKAKQKPTAPKPSPMVKKHIKAEPAKVIPPSPRKGRELGASNKAAPATPKKVPSLPKPKPKTVAKKAPQKKVVSKLQSSVKKKAAPTKAKPPQKKVVKKAPVKGR